MQENGKIWKWKIRKIKKNTRVDSNSNDLNYTDYDTYYLCLQLHHMSQKGPQTISATWLLYENELDENK